MNRREFIRKTFGVMAGLSLLPAVASSITFQQALTEVVYNKLTKEKTKYYHFNLPPGTTEVNSWLCFEKGNCVAKIQDNKNKKILGSIPIDIKKQRYLSIYYTKT